MKSRIQSQALHHELCFPTVPNDPLVPTAVLGEARKPYHQSLFYFPFLHASQLLAWVVSCPHSNSLLESPLVFQIDSHSPDRDSKLCSTHFGLSLVDLNGRHCLGQHTSFMLCWIWSRSTIAPNGQQIRINPNTSTARNQEQLSNQLMRERQRQQRGFLSLSTLKQLKMQSEVKRATLFICFYFVLVIVY